MDGEGYSFHASGKEMQAGIAIFMSDKTDFKSKTIKWDKEGHYVIIVVNSSKEQL